MTLRNIYHKTAYFFGFMNVVHGMGKKKINNIITDLNSMHLFLHMHKHVDLNKRLISIKREITVL